jgi:transcriptional regulator with XRE-family HTH domain
VKFAEKLRRLCAAKGWAQARILTLVPDVSKSTVSTWFAGRYVPDLYQALTIANELGVSVDYLADDSIDEPPAPPAPEINDDERFVVTLYRDLGLTRAEAARALMRAEREAPVT